MNGGSTKRPVSSPVFENRSGSRGAEAWRSRKPLNIHRPEIGYNLSHAAAIEDELDPEQPERKTMAEVWRAWARAFAQLRGRDRWPVDNALYQDIKIL
jgi:hypothetical protein